MLEKIYSRSIKFLPLISPLAILTASTPAVLYSSYPYFIVFFISFYALNALIQAKGGQDTGFGKLLWFGGLLSSTACMLFSLSALKNSSHSQIPFLVALAAMTAITFHKSAQRSDHWLPGYLFMFIANFLICFGGFESLGFSRFYSTIFYSLSTACMVSGQQIVQSFIDNQLEPNHKESQPETRKQRRKKKAIERDFAGTRPERVLSAGLLLMGPAILITLALSNFLESKFSAVVFIYLLIGPLMRNLLPSNSTTHIEPNFIRQCTGFSYLFFVMILLIKIIPL